MTADKRIFYLVSESARIRAAPAPDDFTLPLF